MSGYLSKKFFKYHKCNACEQIILLNPDSVTYSDEKLYTSFKNSDSNKLNFVSETTFQTILAWEHVFQKNFKNIFHEKKISKVIGNLLHNACPALNLCSPDKSLAFMDIFIKSRCHWEARFLRRNYKEHQFKQSLPPTKNRHPVKNFTPQVNCTN